MPKLKLDIDSLSVSAAGAISAAVYAGVALAGAGAGSINTISNTTQAIVSGGSQIGKASSVTVKATSDADILAKGMEEAAKRLKK